MPVPDPAHERLARHLTAHCPKTVWIELTSKCPYRCVFCSREHERGAGQHMDFALYRSVLAQLKNPHLIRLNYSGESIFYPHLVEAVALAHGTGAKTELVTALGGASYETLEGLIDAGLDRLSVSLHSLDDEGYRRLLGHGEPHAVRERLEFLAAARTRSHLDIDLAFVALEENLPQLTPLAAYAARLGLRRISIHPVIRRGEIPVAFPAELDARNRLRPAFLARIDQAVAAAAQRHPSVSLVVARPDTQQPPAGDITTCEQNPWDTAHILADGTVVVCEVHDRAAMGNLGCTALSDIWNGPRYQSFRLRYLTGAQPACSACPWRETVVLPLARELAVRGWHPPTDDAIRWSEADAALVVRAPAAANAVEVDGLLPPAPSHVSILAGGGTPVTLRNSGPDIARVQALVPVAGGRTHVLRIDASRYCPSDAGAGHDHRNLGFALAGISFRFTDQRRRAVERVLRLLERAARTAVPWHLPRLTDCGAPGVAVLVPARGDSAPLAATLTAALRNQPTEIIVTVSAMPRDRLAVLRRQFPGVRWIVRTKPLGFGQAVELGLRHVRHDWVYLLNSDMELAPGAIAALLPVRAPDLFAAGSRICMNDGSAVETNWTSLRRVPGDAVALVERDPAQAHGPCGCLYAGGRSGLFRTALLKRLVKRTRAYTPFYWEDVEWGALAWRHGYRSVFCPLSEARHHHRATISRYYGAAEIEAAFERNRLRFHLRNLDGVRELEQRLLELDGADWNALFHPLRFAPMLWARAIAANSPLGEDVLFQFSSCA